MSVVKIFTFLPFCSMFKLRKKKRLIFSAPSSGSF